MNYDILEKMASSGLSTRGMAKELNVCQTTIRYWLNKHNILRKTDIRPVTCRLCNKPLKDGRRLRCSGCNTRVRRMRTKLAAIDLLGGKCSKCGWTGLPAGFDFHHVSSDKEFTIGQVANKAWPVIKAELSKCILLCRNCHSIHHSKHDDVKLMAEVEQYKSIKQ